MNKTLEQRVEAIEKRNQAVAADKAWETSKTRRVLVMLFTYLTIGFYLQAIGIPNPWLNSIVPAIAFLLSTLTLPFLKDLWKKHWYK